VKGQVMKKYIERYWRGATREDTIKEPPMVARFRNLGTDWAISRLYSWDRERNLWCSEDGHCRSEAEVYDAPDPGEGYELVDPTEAWRLIEVDEGTAREQGLEFSFGQEWTSIKEDLPFGNDAFYRRKIVQSPTSESVATPAACEQILSVRVSVDGKDVFVRPLLPSEDINSGDIRFEDGVWEKAYTAVGLLQSNADHQYYREVRQLQLQQVVQNPISRRDDGQWLYGGVPIDDGLYAVIDADGKYLCWTGMTLPSFGNDFIQGNTLRELAQLDPRNFEFTKLRKVEAYYPGDPRPRPDHKAVMKIHPVERLPNGEGMTYRGEPIKDTAYAVINERGKYLCWPDGDMAHFEVEFRQAFTPRQLQKVNMEMLRSVRLVPVVPEEMKCPAAQRKAGKVVPYEWSDEALIFGREYRRKFSPTSHYRVWATELVDGRFFINEMDAEGFLDTFVWMDGAPCGKAVEEKMED
jgi:hypothetical protein